MKKHLISTFIIALIVIVALSGCKKSSDIDPTPPEPTPTPTPTPTEQLIGTMFFHDTGPTSQYDIFMGELYIVPISSSSSSTAGSGTVEGFSNRDRTLITGINTTGRNVVTPGVHKLYNIEYNGKILERVCLSTTATVDMSEYEFEVRNVENLTNSDTDDFAVNFNGDNLITFVTDPDGLAASSNNTEIAYMDIDSGERTQITPINGEFSGGNFDPDWKTENTIVWSHQGEIREVNISDLTVSESLVPEVDSSLFDPKYSLDGTMLLFNTRHNRKKNSYIKYLNTGEIVHLLPVDYFNAYADDNPTWIFSNDLITGHLLDTNHDNGQIYTLELSTQQLTVITDGSRDFRYVTPIDLEGDIYLIFSDWTDESNIALWISSIDGSDLRELDQTGDEAIFNAAGLPVPEDEEEMQDIAYQYTLMFQY